MCFCVSSVNDWEFTFLGGYFHDPVDKDVCSVWLLAVASFNVITCGPYVFFCISSVNNQEFTFLVDIFMILLIVMFVQCGYLYPGLVQLIVIHCLQFALAPWMRQTVVVVRIEMCSGTWFHQTLCWPWYQMDWIQCFFPWMSRPVLCTSLLREPHVLDFDTSIFFGGSPAAALSMVLWASF